MLEGRCCGTATYCAHHFVPSGNIGAADDMAQSVKPAVNCRPLRRLAIKARAGPSPVYASACRRNVVKLTSVRVWVLQSCSILLYLLQQSSDSSWIPDISVLLEHGSNLDGLEMKRSAGANSTVISTITCTPHLVSPDVPSDIPVERVLECAAVKRLAG